MSSPTYYCYLGVPYKMVNMRAYRYDRKTGRFVRAPETMVIDLFFLHDVEDLSFEEFVQRVERRRAMIVKEEGTLHTWYEVVRAIEEKAQLENRRLTSEESASILEIRRKTYYLFNRLYDSPNNGDM